MSNAIDIDMTRRELADAIEDAAYGIRSWDEVTRIYTDVFAGSFAAIITHDLGENRAFNVVHAGLDRSYMKSYADYYSGINPWNPHWLHMQTGACHVCNNTFPTSTIEHTEFYQDWLRCAGDFDSAVGLKAGSTDGELVHLAVHYPNSLSGQYDRQVYEVTRHLGPVVSRALRSARLQVRTMQNLSMSSALSACGSEPSFVVNADCRVMDANTAGQDLLRDGEFLFCFKGMIGIRESGACARMRRDVKRLARSPAVDVERSCVVGSGGAWAVSYTRLPGSDSAVPILFDRLVLVRFRKMTAVAHSAGLGGLASAYGLTGAEQRLCEKLSLGLTVSLAAEELSWTYETGRSTLKQIFAKMNVGRQSELVRLLDRWLTP
ncbi:helix-turn-helix transcriptional regulator [Stappia sp.]|uniref:helix-turn-helix transcriptional regulator n=1 Tax=Stappia sp. TaxID=1870903 RepID=UPI003A9A366F